MFMDFHSMPLVNFVIRFSEFVALGWLNECSAEGSFNLSGRAFLARA
jgi:hypothetical protein